MHDRPYWKEDGGGGGGGARVAGGLPKPGRVIAALLMINIAVFVLAKLVGDRPLFDMFAVIPGLWWQPWRYITFQFLHGGGLHLFFNMLALYFLGMNLESVWGGKRFLTFYLTCGVVAGVCHVVLTLALGSYSLRPLVGASGGVYGVLVACAVMFPHIKLLIGFIFPMSIRLVVAIFLGIAVLNVVSDVAAAVRGDHPIGGGVSDPAHLGGALAAGFWIWVLPKMRRRAAMGRDRMGRGRWEKKRLQQRARHEEVDHILDKIREGGIGSLSRSEKRKLQEETQRQQRDGR